MVTTSQNRNDLVCNWFYTRSNNRMKKGEVTLLWRGNRIPCEDCKVVFKNKFGKEYTVEISRLIRVFNNNIWQHSKSVK